MQLRKNWRVRCCYYNNWLVRCNSERIEGEARHLLCLLNRLMQLRKNWRTRSASSRQRGVSVLPMQLRKNWRSTWLMFASSVEDSGCNSERIEGVCLARKELCHAWVLWCNSERIEGGWAASWQLRSSQRDATQKELKGVYLWIYSSRECLDATQKELKV